MSDVSIRIKEHILASGHSVDTLAQFVGISKEALHDVVEGRVQPSIETIQQIAGLLNISTDDILKPSPLQKFTNKNIYNLQKSEIRKKAEETRLRNAEMRRMGLLPKKRYNRGKYINYPLFIEILNKKNMEIPDLADRTGLTRTAIYAWKDKKASYRSLARVVDVLGIREQDLWRENTKTAIPRSIPDSDVQGETAKMVAKDMLIRILDGKIEAIQKVKQELLNL